MLPVNDELSMLNININVTEPEPVNCAGLEPATPTLSR